MKCNMKLGVGLGSYANFVANTGMNYSLIGFSENTNRNYHIGYRTTSTSIVKSLSGDTGIYHNYKFIVDNGSVTFYIDGVSQGTATISWLNNYSDFTFGYWTWGSGSANVKNMSIKPL